MILRLSILLSLLFHFAVLQYKPKIKEPQNTDKHKKKKNKKKGNGPSKVSVKFKNMTRRGKEPCDNSYTGIGVMYSWVLEEITDVSKGGPADRAGIKVGDILKTNTDFTKLKPGTIVEVVIERKGITITKKIIIDKICTNGE